MFNRLRQTFRTIWFFFTFGATIVVGYLLYMGFLWLLGQPWFQALAQESTSAADFVGRLVTAVKIVAGLFFTTWGLRFLDQFFLRDGLINRFGFFPRSSFSPFRLIFSNFLHGNMSHLVGNTRPLLAFSALAVLLLPDLSLLVPIFLFLMVVQGIGVWFFGRKLSSHIGASGLVLGLFSFDLFHGLFAGSWKTAVALILLLVSGRAAFRTLTSRGPLPGGAEISVAGHVWGFLSGIFAAYLISPFGPFAVG